MMDGVKYGRVSDSSDVGMSGGCGVGILARGKEGMMER